MASGIKGFEQMHTFPCCKEDHVGMGRFKISPLQLIGSLNCLCTFAAQVQPPSPGQIPKQTAECIFETEFIMPVYVFQCCQSQDAVEIIHLTEGGSSMMEHKTTPLTQEQTEVNLKTKLNICSKKQLSNA